MVRLLALAAIGRLGTVGTLLRRRPVGTLLTLSRGILALGGVALGGGGRLRIRLFLLRRGWLAEGRGRRNPFVFRQVPYYEGPFFCPGSAI